jgi:hypothetical protein
VRLIARFPRIAAWVVACALVGAVTAEALVGLGLTQAATPQHCEHAHGVVVAMRATGQFALRVAGRPGLLWLQPAIGAPISLAHVWRHLREHAATDVIYSEQPHGVLIAWSAD